MDFTRKIPRLKASLPFLLPDGWKGEAVDLSANGIRIQCILLLEKDTEVTGTLVLPDGKSVELTGTVVWTAPPVYADYTVPGEVGLELTEVSPEYLSVLANLFAED
jgi:hypothetical protein